MTGTNTLPANHIDVITAPVKHLDLCMLQLSTGKLQPLFLSNDGSDDDVLALATQHGLSVNKILHRSEISTDFGLQIVWYDLDQFPLDDANRRLASKFRLEYGIMLGYEAGWNACQDKQDATGSNPWKERLNHRLIMCNWGRNPRKLHGSATIPRLQQALERCIPDESKVVDDTLVDGVPDAIFAAIVNGWIACEAAQAMQAAILAAA
jgi:hypothetical protein